MRNSGARRRVEVTPGHDCALLRRGSYGMTAEVCVPATAAHRPARVIRNALQSSHVDAGAAARSSASSQVSQRMATRRSATCTPAALGSFALYLYRSSFFQQLAIVALRASRRCAVTCVPKPPTAHATAIGIAFAHCCMYAESPLLGIIYSDTVRYAHFVFESFFGFSFQHILALEDSFNDSPFTLFRRI